MEKMVRNCSNANFRLDSATEGLSTGAVECPDVFRNLPGRNAFSYSCAEEFAAAQPERAAAWGMGEIHTNAVEKLEKEEGKGMDDLSGEGFEGTLENIDDAPFEWDLSDTSFDMDESRETDQETLGDTYSQADIERAIDDMGLDELRSIRNEIVSEGLASPDYNEGTDPDDDQKVLSLHK